MCSNLLGSLRLDQIMSKLLLLSKSSTSLALVITFMLLNNMKVIWYVSKGKVDVQFER